MVDLNLVFVSLAETQSVLPTRLVQEKNGTNHVFVTSAETQSVLPTRLLQEKMEQIMFS